MNEPQPETWRFTAKPGHAQKVYLVVDSPTAPSRWIEMQSDTSSPGTWSITAQIDPGRSRVRYFTAEDGAYLNCGSVGLHGERENTFDDPFDDQPTPDLAASA